MPSLSPDLVSFIHSAKLATYAAQGDEATVRPALPDSKQLEFSRGLYLYRDIYFGMLRFVGQEVVYVDGRAVWSMAYSGGLRAGVASSEASLIYGALRAALSAAPPDLPLRGPSQFDFGGLSYRCEPNGDPANFRGDERLSRDGEVLFELHFAGGALR